MYCVTSWQSWGYHSNAADLAAERALPERPANVREARATRAAPSYTPARVYDRPAHSPGPRSSPYQSQRPHPRPNPGSDRDQRFRPPHQHPQARGHAQHEHLEPWEDRQTRLDGGRHQPKLRSASAESSRAPWRAEQSETAPPGVLASRSPAFGKLPDDRAPPQAHESPQCSAQDTGARLVHDADKGKIRRTIDIPQQQLRTQWLQDHSGGFLGFAQCQLVRGKVPGAIIAHSTTCQSIGCLFIIPVGLVATSKYSFIGYALNPHPCIVTLRTMTSFTVRWIQLMVRCVSGAVVRMDEPQRMEQPILEMPDGNPQPYILWQADEACRLASKAAAEEFLIRMAEVLDKRSDSLTRTNISTMFHRCAKVMNATIQARMRCSHAHA